MPRGRLLVLVVLAFGEGPRPTVRPDGVEAANLLPFLAPRFCPTDDGRGQGGPSGPWQRRAAGTSHLADLCLSKHTPSAYTSFTVGFCLCFWAHGPAFPPQRHPPAPPPVPPGSFLPPPALHPAPALLPLFLSAPTTPAPV